MRLPDLANLHGNIAGDVWPHGATLTCERCGHAEHAARADCGRYLARGWPTHCGETMILSRPTTEAR